MDTVLQDLRYAWRSLRRQPAFALLAIGTLSLGIGANAAIFSAVNAVLLRPLDYPHPDRIVALTTQWQKTGRRGTVSAPDFHDWHDGQDSFRRVELTAQQLIPTHAERGVIDVGARVWLSQSNTGRSVPFFLMPTLGGGDLLRAFPSYRFRDRNALLLKGEYRWAVHKMVDVAGRERLRTGGLAEKVVLIGSRQGGSSSRVGLPAINCGKKPRKSGRQDGY